MWTTKHLVQASCTDLTLQGNWSPVTWTTDFDLREKVAIQNLLYLQFYCHFKPFYHLILDWMLLYNCKEIEITCLLIVLLSKPFSFYFFFMYPYSLYSLHQQPQHGIHGLHGLHGLPHQHQQHQRPTASTLAASAAPASVDKWPHRQCPMPTIDDSLDGLQLAGFRRYGASGLLSTFNGTHTKE